MNADQIRQEVGGLLAKAGIPMVANETGAVTIYRGWAQDNAKRDPIEYWQVAIRTVCENASIGAKVEGAQVTLLPLPFEIAIEPLHIPLAGKNVTIHRMKFWLAFPGKKWVGLHADLPSPTNAELGDSRNWKDA